MRRFNRLTRAVLIPVAALTILVGSAVPASAATPDTTLSQVVTLVPAKGAGIIRTLGMNW